MIKISSIFWLAGFLDGEGTFIYNGSSPRLQVISTDLDLIQRCKREMNVTTNIYNVKRYESHHKRAHGLTINGSFAVSWMMTLYPLMSIRRKSEIREVIEKWKIHRSHNNGVCVNGHPQTKENLIFTYDSSSSSGYRMRCKWCKRMHNRGLSY